MGRIGFGELLVIFIIALLIFGPSKLPEIGKSLGEAISQFRQASKNLKSSVSSEEKDETHVS